MIFIRKKYILKKINVLFHIYKFLSTKKFQKKNENFTNTIIFKYMHFITMEITSTVPEHCNLPLNSMPQSDTSLILKHRWHDTFTETNLTSK